jgi:DNA-binding MarR family transcriptional regulator
MDTETLAAAKRQATFELLIRTARIVNETALARVRAATGTEIRAVHTSLLPHIDLQGTRLTEIARRAGVSKQAVGQLVDELEAWGAVERVPDPSDGRAKLVRFARGGSSLLEGLAVLKQLETDLARRVGRARLNRLQEDLQAVLEATESLHSPGR